MRAEIKTMDICKLLIQVGVGGWGTDRSADGFCRRGKEQRAAPPPAEEIALASLY